MDTNVRIRKIVKGNVEKQEMYKFKNKIAIVTGAGSGIGRSLALKLADDGARVVITDRFQDRIDQLLVELRDKGVTCGGYRVNHSKLNDVKRFADDFFKEWGHVDILCCNAGIGDIGRLEELTIEDWERMMSVNLWGTIYMVHLFIPKMIERKSGSILITASLAGLISLPGMAPYCTSKHAMVGLAESLRCELIKHNIKVTVLCPGTVKTNIIKDSKIYHRDNSGKSSADVTQKFFEKHGVDPSIVANDAIKALSKDKGIKLTPCYPLWPMYLLYRISPSVCQSILRLIWKRNLLPFVHHI